MKDDAIQKGVRKVAAFLSGPGGEAVSLDLAVASQLEWFTAARERGLRWRSIAALLTQAGARRPGGTALSGAQLTAVYSRQIAKQRSAKARKMHPSNKRGRSSMPLPQIDQQHPQLTPNLAFPDQGLPPGGSPAQAPHRARRQSDEAGRLPKPERISPGAALNDPDLLRERMRRAAAARNGGQD